MHFSFSRLLLTTENFELLLAEVFCREYNKENITRGIIQMREAYDSDITREQYEIISNDLESLKKKTRPRDVDLYDVFCAILYLLKNGCTWRNIPHDFPKWRTVRYYYEVWTKPNKDGETPLDHILSKLVDTERLKAGRNPTPSLLIIDSKSVQNADCAEEKGYDGGKKKRV